MKFAFCVVFLQAVSFCINYIVASLNPFGSSYIHLPFKKEHTYYEAA